MNILVRELYGQSSARIRYPSINIKSSQKDFSKEYLKQPDKELHSRGLSPTYIQSRYFHFDQLLRDNRDLNHPSPFQSQFVSPYYYSYGGFGANVVGSNQEGCRLKNNHCSHDYQCCSGKCRCVRWSLMGKMSCWKKCF